MTEETKTAKCEIGDPFEALTHFFIQGSTQSHGAARVAACLLLGLYNGYRFPFDLTDLRLLDETDLTRALALLKFDARPSMEVHEWLNRLYGRRDFGQRFEHMAHAWRLKGRCKEEGLEDVPAIAWEGGAQ